MVQFEVVSNPGFKSLLVCVFVAAIHQLIFQPDPVAWSLIVCVPEFKLTVVVTVVQFCHPPVFGILTVARTVLPDFTWHIPLVPVLAILRLIV